MVSMVNGRHNVHEINYILEVSRKDRHIFIFFYLKETELDNYRKLPMFGNSMSLYRNSFLNGDAYNYVLLTNIPIIP